MIISYILFELDYSYHSRIFFENRINSYFKSHLANKLASKLGDLILIC